MTRQFKTCKVCGAVIECKTMGRPRTMCQKCSKLNAERRSRINPNWDKYEPKAKPKRKPKNVERPKPVVVTSKCDKPADTLAKLRYPMGGCGNCKHYDPIADRCAKQCETVKRVCPWWVI